MVQRLSKWLAGSVAVIFLFNTIFQPLAEASIWEDRAIRQTSWRTSVAKPGLLHNQLPAVSKPVLDFTPKLNLKLSSSLRDVVGAISHTHGLIQEINDAKTSHPPVVLLQDIHMNTEAQNNIAKLLQGLLEKGKIGLVGIEGAFAPLDFAPFRRYADKIKARWIVQSYLDKNKLAAPSFVGITSPSEPPLFIGIDDRTHYDANVNAYRDSRDLKNKVLRELDQSKRQLLERKRATFGPELLNFDEVRSAYHQASLEMGSYVEKLGAGDELVLATFLEAYRMERLLDFNRVEHERKAVLERLASKLTEQELQDLLNQSLAYRTGQLSFGAYYTGLRKLCAERGVSLQSAPAFHAYIQYVLLADGIKADKLFDAIERRENDRLHELVRNSAEWEIIKQSDHLALVSKLVEFSLTPKEWEKYQTSHAHANIACEAFENFYKEADIRSRKMFENLSLSTKHQALSTVIVVGGFHTPLLTQYLRQKKTSYVVVSPKLTKVDPAAGSAYLSVFDREKTPLQKLLSGEKLFLAPQLNTPTVGEQLKISFRGRLDGDKGVSIDPHDPTRDSTNFQQKVADVFKIFQTQPVVPADFMVNAVAAPPQEGEDLALYLRKVLSLSETDDVQLFSNKGTFSTVYKLRLERDGRALEMVAKIAATPELDFEFCADNLMKDVAVIEAVYKGQKQPFDPPQGVHFPDFLGKVATEDGRPIVILEEFIASEPLAEWLVQKGPAERLEAARLLRLALQYLSDKGFVLWDMQPDSFRMNGNLNLIDLGSYERKENFNQELSVEKIVDVLMGENNTHSNGMGSIHEEKAREKWGHNSWKYRAYMLLGVHWEALFQVVSASGWWIMFGEMDWYMYAAPFSLMSVVSSAIYAALHPQDNEGRFDIFVLGNLMFAALVLPSMIFGLSWATVGAGVGANFGVHFTWNLVQLVRDYLFYRNLERRSRPAEITVPFKPLEDVVVHAGYHVVRLSILDGEEFAAQSFSESSPEIVVSAQAFSLKPGAVYTFGRDPDNNFVLEDKAVSRHHFSVEVIRKRGQLSLTIRDANSSYGTKVFSGEDQFKLFDRETTKTPPEIKFMRKMSDTLLRQGNFGELLSSDEAKQFDSKLQKNLQRLAVIMLEGYERNVIIVMDRELTPRTLAFAQSILNSVKNDIPIELLAKFPQPLFIHAAQIEHPNVLGYARMETQGELAAGVSQVEAGHGSITSIISHELVHKLAITANKEGTDLLFPIRNWLLFFLSQDYLAARVDGKKVNLVDHINDKKHSFEVVKKRIRALRGHNFTGNPGKYYAMDPHEILAWNALGEGEGRFGKDPEKIRTILERNLLRSGDFVFRFNAADGKWDKVHSPKTQEIVPEQKKKRLGSIYDKQAREKWGEDSWKYKLYTVFGVNWEVVFNLPIVIVGLADASNAPVLTMVLSILLWINSAANFATAHRPRTRGRLAVLFAVGLVLGAPFVLQPYGFWGNTLVSMGSHSLYNVLVLFTPLGRWLPAASIANQRLIYSPESAELVVLTQNDIRLTWAVAEKLTGEKYDRRNVGLIPTLIKDIGERLNQAEAAGDDVLTEDDPTVVAMDVLKNEFKIADLEERFNALMPYQRKLRIVEEMANPEIATVRKPTLFRNTIEVKSRALPVDPQSPFTVELQQVRSTLAITGHTRTWWRFNLTAHPELDDNKFLADKLAILSFALNLIFNPDPEVRRALRSEVTAKEDMTMIGYHDTFQDLSYADILGNSQKTLTQETIDSFFANPEQFADIFNDKLVFDLAKHLGNKDHSRQEAFFLAGVLGSPLVGSFLDEVVRHFNASGNKKVIAEMAFGRRVLAGEEERDFANDRSVHQIAAGDLSVVSHVKSITEFIRYVREHRGTGKMYLYPRMWHVRGHAHVLAARDGVLELYDQSTTYSGVLGMDVFRKLHTTVGIVENNRYHMHWIVKDEDEMLPYLSLRASEKIMELSFSEDLANEDLEADDPIRSHLFVLTGAAFDLSGRALAFGEDGQLRPSRDPAIWISVLNNPHGEVTKDKFRDLAIANKQVVDEMPDLPADMTPRPAVEFPYEVFQENNPLVKSETGPASIFDAQAKERWGENSWKYKLYTVFGVNWEVMYQLPIVLAANLDGYSMQSVIVVWIVMAVWFGWAHRDRSWPERAGLMFIGLGLGAPFVFSPLGFVPNLFISTGLHSLHNFLKLIGLLPKWWPMASIPHEFKNGFKKIEFNKIVFDTPEEAVIQIMAEMGKTKEGRAILNHQEYFGFLFFTFYEVIKNKVDQYLSTHKTSGTVPKALRQIEVSLYVKSNGHGRGQYIEIAMPGVINIDKVRRALPDILGVLKELRAADDEILTPDELQLLKETIESIEVLMREAQVSGKAIPETDIYTLFLRPFFTEKIDNFRRIYFDDDSASKRYLGGAGKGLYVVERVAESLDIGVYFSGRERKTQFIINIPKIPSKVNGKLEEGKTRKIAQTINNAYERRGRVKIGNVGQLLNRLESQRLFEVLAHLDGHILQEIIPLVSFRNILLHSAPEMVRNGQSMERAANTPASILDAQAKERWGEDSWKYKLYTVFGVNWEVMYQLPVALTSHLEFSMTAKIVVWIVMAVWFGWAHRDRSWPQRIGLMFIGLGLGAPFIFSPLGFVPNLFISTGLHSLNNFLKLKGWLPQWWPTASMRRGSSGVNLSQLFGDLKRAHVKEKFSVVAEIRKRIIGIRTKTNLSDGVRVFILWMTGRDRNLAKEMVRAILTVLENNHTRLSFTEDHRDQIFNMLVSPSDHARELAWEIVESIFKYRPELVPLSSIIQLLNNHKDFQDEGRIRRLYAFYLSANQRIEPANAEHVVRLSLLMTAGSVDVRTEALRFLHAILMEQKNSRKHFVGSDAARLVSAWAQAQQQKDNIPGSLFSNIMDIFANPPADRGLVPEPEHTRDVLDALLVLYQKALKERRKDKTLQLLDEYIPTIANYYSWHNHVELKNEFAHFLEGLQNGFADVKSDPTGSVNYVLATRGEDATRNVRLIFEGKSKLFRLLNRPPDSDSMRDDFSNELGEVLRKYFERKNPVLLADNLSAQIKNAGPSLKREYLVTLLREQINLQGHVQANTNDTWKYEITQQLISQIMDDAGENAPALAQTMAVQFGVWRPGQDFTRGSSVSEFDNLLHNEENLRALIAYATFLRHLYPYDMERKEDLAPLAYALKTKTHFPLGGGLYLAPVTQSFRRHIIFSMDKEGNVGRRAELKIPGLVPNKRDVSAEGFSMAQTIHNVFPEIIEEPIALLTLRSELRAYGASFSQEEPFRVAVFAYETDAHRLPNKDFEKVSDEDKEKIIRSAVETVAKRHVLRLHAGLDGGIDNYRLEFRVDGTPRVYLAGDTEDYYVETRVGYLAAELVDIRTLFVSANFGVNREKLAEWYFAARKEAQERYELYLRQKNSGNVNVVVTGLVVFFISLMVPWSHLVQSLSVGLFVTAAVFAIKKVNPEKIQNPEALAERLAQIENENYRFGTNKDYEDLVLRWISYFSWIKESDGYRHLILLFKGRPIPEGFIWGRRDAHEPLIYFEKIVVDANNGLAGQGTHLLEEYFNWAKKTGVKVVDFVSEHSALGFYHRFLTPRVPYEPHEQISFSIDMELFGEMYDATFDQQRERLGAILKKEKTYQKKLSKLSAGDYYVLPATANRASKKLRLDFAVDDEGQITVGSKSREVSKRDVIAEMIYFGGKIFKALQNDKTLTLIAFMLGGFVALQMMGPAWGSLFFGVAAVLGGDGLNRLFITDPQMPKDMAAVTVPAQGHPQVNEDSFFLHSAGVKTIVVFDGMGGHDAGDKASRLARDTVFELIEGPVTASFPQMAQGYLRKADKKIYEAFENAGATIGFSSLFPGGNLLVLHSGDVRVYVEDHGKIELVTVDNFPSFSEIEPEYADASSHALSLQQVQEFLEASDIPLLSRWSSYPQSLSAEEREILLAHLPQKITVYGPDAGKAVAKLLDIPRQQLPEKLSQLSDHDLVRLAMRLRNVVGNVVGSGNFVPVWLMTRLQPGQRVLVLSDGVHDALTTDEIEEIAARYPDEREFALALAGAAKDRLADVNHFRAKGTLGDDLTAAVMTYTGNEEFSDPKQVFNDDQAWIWGNSLGGTVPLDVYEESESLEHSSPHTKMAYEDVLKQLGDAIGLKQGRTLLGGPFLVRTSDNVLDTNIGALAIWAWLTSDLPEGWRPWATAVLAAVVEGSSVWLGGNHFGWTQVTFLGIFWVILVAHILLGHVAWDKEKATWVPAYGFGNALVPSLIAGTSLAAFFGSTPLVSLALAIAPHLIANLLLTKRKRDRSPDYVFRAFNETDETKAIARFVQEYEDSFQSLWSPVVRSLSLDSLSDDLRSRLSKYWQHLYKEGDIELVAVNDYLMERGLYVDEVIVTRNGESYPFLRFSKIDRVNREPLSIYLQPFGKFYPQGKASAWLEYNKMIVIVEPEVEVEAKQIAAKYLVRRPWPLLWWKNYSVHDFSRAALWKDLQESKAFSFWERWVTLPRLASAIQENRPLSGRQTKTLQTLTELLISLRELHEKDHFENLSVVSDLDSEEAAKQTEITQGLLPRWVLLSLFNYVEAKVKQGKNATDIFGGRLLEKYADALGVQADLFGEEGQRQFHAALARSQAPMWMGALLLFVGPMSFAFYGVLIASGLMIAYMLVRYYNEYYYTQNPHKEPKGKRHKILTEMIREQGRRQAMVNTLLELSQSAKVFDPNVDLLTEQEYDFFVREINYLPFHDEPAGLHVAWANNKEQAGQLIKRLLLKGNQGRLVIGYDTESDVAEIMKMNGMTLKALLKSGRLIFVAGNEKTTVADLVNQVPSKERRKMMVSVLIMSGVQLPEAFFNITRADQEYLRIYLVTQAFAAVPIPLSYLPNLGALRKALEAA